MEFRGLMKCFAVSLHVPHYYELWARWADKDNEFWNEAAATSREFLGRRLIQRPA